MKNSSFIKYDLATDSPALKELSLKAITIKIDENSSTKNTLIVLGNFTPLTKEQIEKLLESEGLYLITLNPKFFFNESERKKEILRALLEVSLVINNYSEILLTTASVGNAPKIDFENFSQEKDISLEEISLEILKTLEEITEEILSIKKFYKVLSLI